ncbi:unnamed protein product [Polarella glacialis]|uniref:Uncharacterized protein n=1 Tax=Polarella glacialis TaxID=89957 RepID=A0A813GZJ2_POLGL|nr:unnamed protein product [Polarella glacialis]
MYEYHAVWSARTSFSLCFSMASAELADVQLSGQEANEPAALTVRGIDGAVMFGPALQPVDMLVSELKALILAELSPFSACGGLQLVAEDGKIVADSEPLGACNLELTAILSHLLTEEEQERCRSALEECVARLGGGE